MANNITKRLIKLKTQSRIWLLTILFFPFLLNFIFHKEIINHHYIFLIYTAIGLIWWIWTMMVFKTLIDQRLEENNLLNDLKSEIKKLKDDFELK